MVPAERARRRREMRPPPPPNWAHCEVHTAGSAPLGSPVTARNSAVKVARLLRRRRARAVRRLLGDRASGGEARPSEPPDSRSVDLHAGEQQRQGRAAAGWQGWRPDSALGGELRQVGRLATATPHRHAPDLLQASWHGVVHGLAQRSEFATTSGARGCRPPDWPPIPNSAPTGQRAWGTGGDAYLQCVQGFQHSLKGRCAYPLFASFPRREPAWQSIRRPKKESNATPFVLRESHTRGYSTA